LIRRWYLIGWVVLSLFLLFAMTSAMEASPSGASNQGHITGPLDTPTNTPTNTPVPVYCGPAINFAPAVYYPVGSSAYSVAVGDFNGDGRSDLAAISADLNRISVLIGNGDGTFQAQVNYPVGNFPYSMAMGDFNGDGHLDLVTS